MDFLKTLMLYMSLTFATSVQSAPAPEITPVPTATPVAVVEAVQTQPGEDAAVTATLPPAAESDENAVPEITPNKSYTNLKQGNRSDRVKQLQQRLIDLGYLNEGDADGVYGGQTRKAVLKFQEVNGLSADGVAGDMTQTYLFENPGVLPNPDRATATPAPTATPEPTQAPTQAPAEAEPAAESTIILPEAEPAVARQWLWEANIVMNDDGQPLTCLRQQDGVTVSSKPRLWQRGEMLQLSLQDLVAAMEDWAMQQDDTGIITLDAAGYALVLTPAEGGYTCTVDGVNLPLEEGDCEALTANAEIGAVNGDIAISASFLARALAAETEWDSDESTLMIRLQHKSVAQATD